MFGLSLNNAKTTQNNTNNASTQQFLKLHAQFRAAISQLNGIILDKAQTIELAVTCLLSNGHLLLQDLPGMGKTTLAEGLSRVLGLQFARVQFTNDMLPADILGINMLNMQTQQFEYRPGPIFTQVLLADEINRASPRTQSALLEAMEEKQVSQDGITRPLPTPFFVIATQNPLQQYGVYPLPESQLDRFLMRLSLGFPSKQAELALLKNNQSRQLLKDMKPVLNAQTIIETQQLVTKLYVDDAVLDYMQRLVAATREQVGLHGLSTRALLGLKNAACAHAFLQQREFVIPEDVQAVFAAVAEHRMETAHTQLASASQILNQVPVSA